MKAFDWHAAAISQATIITRFCRNTQNADGILLEGCGDD
ncbi:DUF6434 domain-containing protein [Mesorhizobium sp. ES1-1]|nr:DUF6434 domain-containing protein [Mesorhizobium sp. ES1-1]MBZ9677198.1 DUF6434 domain-containing protein [Mesorhizobium sp. ES1-1]